MLLTFQSALVLEERYQVNFAATLSQNFRRRIPSKATIRLSTDRQALAKWFYVNDAASLAS